MFGLRTSGWEYFHCDFGSLSGLWIFFAYHVCAYSCLPEPFCAHQLSGRVSFRCSSVSMAFVERSVYLQILQLLISWVNDAGPGDLTDRLDCVESCREAIRAVLGMVGIHRMTEVLAEGWQVFTAIKAHGPSPRCLAACIPPIASAAPAALPGDLYLVGHVGHADVLEQEVASAVDWLEDMQSYAEMNGQLQTLEWLMDLRFAMSAVHFTLVHRRP